MKRIVGMKLAGQAVPKALLDLATPQPASTPEAETVPEKAIMIFREGDRLTFHASGPDRDPAIVAVAADPWQIDGDELALGRDGRTVRFTPGEVLLAARYGLFGLSVWYEPETKTKAPEAVRKRKAYRGPRA